VAQHLHRELRVQRRHLRGEVAQEAPGAAAQVDQRAVADVAARAARERHVEAAGQHAEHLGVHALLGALVDALQSAPQAEAQRRLLGQAQDRRAPRGRALVVQARDELREQQARRRRLLRHQLLQHRLRGLATLGLGLIAQRAAVDQRLVAGDVERPARSRRRGCGALVAVVFVFKVVVFVFVAVEVVVFIVEVFLVVLVAGARAAARRGGLGRSGRGPRRIGLA
jgi:hypothetical protein